MSRWHKFSNLTLKQRLFIFELFILLFIARLSIFLLPRHILIAILKRENKKTTVFPSECQLLKAREVGRWISAIRKTTPWRNTCLSEALAARWALSGRAVSNVVILGVKKNENNQLEAHAWLECGDEIILGGGQAVHFTSISRFP